MNDRKNPHFIWTYGDRPPVKTRPVLLKTNARVLCAQCGELKREYRFPNGGEAGMWSS